MSQLSTTFDKVDDNTHETPSDVIARNGSDAQLRHRGTELSTGGVTKLTASEDVTRDATASSVPDAGNETERRHGCVNDQQKPRNATDPQGSGTAGDPARNRRKTRIWRTCSFGCSELRFMNQRAKPGHAYIPTKIEHLANIVTHALLIVPSILGVFWMLHLASTTTQSLSAVIFGVSIFCLFTVSTTFHTISYCGCYSRSLQNFFHIGDRAVIYIFIAASYTPWLTLKEVTVFGTCMLYVVWVMSLCGILYQYTFHEQYKWLETLFYLILGVCPSISIMSMSDHSGVYEMGLGGAVYILGVVFFKCDGLIPFAHAIWHCFVFVGVAFHYSAVCKYLLGANADGAYGLGAADLPVPDTAEKLVFMPANVGA